MADGVGARGPLCAGMLASKLGMQRAGGCGKTGKSSASCSETSTALSVVHRKAKADPIPGRIWVLRYQQSQSALGSQIPLWIWPKELKTGAGNFPDGSQRLRRRPQAWLRSRSED